MKSLRRHRATLIREETTGYYGENGKWLSDTNTIERIIPCCIQPDKDGEYKRFLPEGVIAKDSKILITREELVGTSEVDETKNDVLLINEKEYEVVQVEHWEGLSRIDAYLVVAVRRDKL